jgi:hypothetical protein
MLMPETAKLLHTNIKVISAR